MGRFANVFADARPARGAGGTANFALRCAKGPRSSRAAVAARAGGDRGRGSSAHGWWLRGAEDRQAGGRIEFRGDGSALARADGAAARPSQLPGSAGEHRLLPGQGRARHVHLHALSRRLPADHLQPARRPEPDGPRGGLQSPDHRGIGGSARRHAAGGGGLPRPPRDDRAHAVPDWLGVSARAGMEGMGGRLRTGRPAAPARQPLGPHLRHHRLGQTDDDLRRELPAERNRPRRASAGSSLTVCDGSAPASSRLDHRRRGRARRADRVRTGRRPFLSRGSPAPALPREHLAGAPVTLAGLLGGAPGRPALVVFWASWCGPCAQEAPALERFARTPAGRGRIVGVDWSDALVAARAFIRRYAWTFSNLRDSEGTVGNDYHLTGLPSTFVLDGSGRIRAVLRGPQDERSLAHALASVGQG